MGKHKMGTRTSFPAMMPQKMNRIEQNQDGTPGYKHALKRIANVKHRRADKRATGLDHE